MPCYKFSFKLFSCVFSPKIPFRDLQSINLFVYKTVCDEMNKLSHNEIRASNNVSGKKLCNCNSFVDSDYYKEKLGIEAETPYKQS